MVWPQNIPQSIGYDRHLARSFYMSSIPWSKPPQMPRCSLLELDPGRCIVNSCSQRLVLVVKYALRGNQPTRAKARRCFCGAVAYRRVVGSFCCLPVVDLLDLFLFLGWIIRAFQARQPALSLHNRTRHRTRFTKSSLLLPCTGGVQPLFPPRESASICSDI